jgi:hypothetical protein
VAKQYPASRVVVLALPALVLVGYGYFVVATYWPYLDWNFRLRSPALAGLPEDVIGFGFWMWWPFFAVFRGLGCHMAIGGAAATPRSDTAC